MSTKEYANAAHPAQLPVRPQTEAYPVQARLIGLDGEETWIAATVVRHAPGHVMCRIPAGPRSSPRPMGYTRAESSYLWLVNDDVHGCRNTT